MQKVISNGEQCIQHEGTHAKAPVQSIIVNAPLELLHIDLTSIEMMMELDQPSNMVNILVFCGHFIKHVMVYVTPDQTARTVDKFLGKVTSHSSEHWPSSQVIEEPTLKATSSESFVSLWGYGRLGLYLTMFKPMDRWNDLTKH